MKKIIFTMSNGKDYILSKPITSAYSPFYDDASAKRHIRIIMDGYTSILTDDDTKIFMSNVSSTKIIDA